jgi:hypothetical protein
MRMKQSLIAIILIVSFASVGNSQTPATNRDGVTPDFRVQIWGDIGADFKARIGDYFDLRTKLQKGLPALAVTDDPAEIGRAEHALAKKIRRARAGAKQGEIFTVAISAEFRKVLRLEINPNTWAALMDDNPGEFSRHINGSYPKKRPLSTVPPNILAVLPALPDDIQYRFIGRDLVLHDTRANIILDKIPYAIQCTECEEMTRDP